MFFTVFLKNRNISSKIKRSKVTDYAALNGDATLKVCDLKMKALIIPCHLLQTGSKSNDKIIKLQTFV